MQKSFEWKWVCGKWAEIHFAKGYIMVFICISNMLVYAYHREFHMNVEPLSMWNTEIEIWHYAFELIRF